ncbi:UDP-N-acetylmuramate dehydrogenase [Sphingobacterium bovistauri]|uniref:UDP-N-acetylenolpyruvoylglucosamine reductase n=1 Tax=Sphingobacterium bovistauri TaxID=2781959 RepID=A0ABS7Z8L2_9SPHI|nr:UDP-N-acetylmuramate dehydrogenase [Sphingobacterium bovistauri]MCA5005289.1 UDP-N-acetylmuramate dehydrogenase [Sphingobacterium bovistauri]
MLVEIQRNIFLKDFNTFRVQSSATQFIDIQDEKKLIDLFKAGIFKDRFFVIGGGSNILFTKNFDGTIIKISNKGIQHFIEGSNIFLTAAAGEVWNDFVWYAVNHDFPGLENMALIPGTVGASPIQNIGAYGTELMDVMYTCRAFDTLTGEFKTFSNHDCGFSYRDSIFKSKYKGRYIIVSVTYKLNLHTKRNTSYGAIELELTKRNIQTPSIKDVAEVVSFIRVEKLPDPSMIGNAGSFFKNPIISNSQLESLKQLFPTIISYTIDEQCSKVAAGWLIEQCGWKGKEIGEVAIWKNQALVITNKGNATGKEIFQISQEIIDSVLKKFGIELEREVNIL